MIRIGFPKTKPFETRDQVREYLSGDKIQCLICGREFYNVGRHIPVHGLSAVEYKQRYQIPKSWGLLTKQAKENKAKNISPEQKKFCADLQSDSIINRTMSTDWLKQERSNDLASFRDKIELPKGSDHYNAVLNESDVRNILSSKETTAELSRKYGVSFSAIAGIRKKRKWKHIQ